MFDIKNSVFIFGSFQDKGISKEKETIQSIDSYLRIGHIEQFFVRFKIISLDDFGHRDFLLYLIIDRRDFRSTVF